LRVEAASYGGRASFFQVVGPWSRPARQTQEPQRGAGLVRFGLFILAITMAAGALGLARYNVRSGRGDRRGATRISLFVLAVMIAAWVLGAQHAREPLAEFNHFRTMLAEQLLYVGTLWVVYLALEPYVRRYYPETLMSWTRLIGGRILDPRVGRDILVGIAGGVAIGLLRLGIVLVPHALGYPPATPRGINLEFLRGTRHVLSMLLSLPPNALFNSMLITLAFVAARLLVKRTWLAAVIAGVPMAFVLLLQSNTELPVLNITFALAMAAIYLLILVQLGVFAQTMAFLTSQVIAQGGLTADFSKLYSATSLWLIVLIAGTAAFGFYASRAGEPLFGKVMSQT
jgi:hypothetical protein